VADSRGVSFSLAQRFEADGPGIESDGELPDGFAITVDHVAATIAAQGPSARVGRGDRVLVPTGQSPGRRRARQPHRPEVSEEVPCLL
jgi:hypothetical protein